MSKYTTEVRYICETYAGLTESSGYEKVDDTIDKAIPFIFDFDFPIYDTEYRNVLEHKILKHYYTREIGFETVGLWKLKLSTLMNEIMPYYNNFYAKFAEGVDAYTNVDYKIKRDNKEIGDEEHSDIDGGTETDTTTRNETSNQTLVSSTKDNGSSNTTDTLNANDWNLFNDTPQGGLNGIESHTYLTEATNITQDHDGTSNTTTNNTSDIDSSNDSTTESTEKRDKNRNLTRNGNSNFRNTREYVEHVFGKNGGETYGELMEKYVNKIIDVDMMIIRSLEELFLGLW